MYLKLVKETSETRESLDQYDITYMLNLYEGLTLNDYVDALYKKDISLKQEAIEKANKNKPRKLGG